ncbi:MAG: DNA-directed RNA polymerase subunit omega [Chthoniobacter sp.]
MQSHLLEKALTVIKSEQYLVNVISRRVRQLSNGHRPMVQVELRMGLADIALTEVIEGSSPTRRRPLSSRNPSRPAAAMTPALRTASAPRKRFALSRQGDSAEVQAAQRSAFNGARTFLSA